MPKSKASKEPPKVKEEEATPAECEEDLQPEEEVVMDTPVEEVASPIIVEPPIEQHLAQMVIERFDDEEADPLFTGYRSVSYHGGHSYTGDFMVGKMHGEGEYVWSNGLKYKGDFRENTISGRGMYIWPDNSVYKGDVENGLRHGKGTFYCTDSPSIYSGDWVHGRRTGTGKMSYDKDEFSYYMGEWKDNKKCGRGFRQYASGSTYDGDWLDNVRHGKGTMHWEGTGESYTGDWYMGIQHGEGTQCWLVDASSQLPLKNEYKGMWKNGKRHGQGVFTYASGAKYDGEWSDNAKHGFGKFFFKDGSVFSGNFENDSIVGRPGSPDRGKMMKSAITTGRATSPLANSTKTSQSSFQLNITSLIADEMFLEEELQQVQNVLLRHISYLRRIYNSYCKLRECDSGVLFRMEFWKLLKDCGLYLRIPMPRADEVISDAMEIECEIERQSPFTRFLFRQFLQSLVFLAIEVCSSQVTRENGCYVAQCLSALLNDHILNLNPNETIGYSHSHPINKLYIERCWKAYLHLSKRTKNGFTFREILFVLKDIGLLSNKQPHLSVEAVINDVMLSTNQNMSNDGSLFLDIHINFFDFFNVLCGCALVLKHSSPLPFNIHSNIGTETEMSNCVVSLSPDKTPASDSPSKSLSKKNTPSETPTPGPDSPVESDGNDVDASTPVVESVASIDNIHESIYIASPSIDERCGSFEDWESRIEDFFVCHFFPKAEHLIDVERRVAEKRLAETPAAEHVESEDEIEPVVSIELHSPSSPGVDGHDDESSPPVQAGVSFDDSSTGPVVLTASA